MPWWHSLGSRALCATPRNRLPRLRRHHFQSDCERLGLQHMTLATLGTTPRDRPRPVGLLGPRA
eukprot:11165165-Prorocentrum_lima.AAC.1